MRTAKLGQKLHGLVLKNSHDYSPYYSKIEKEFLDQYNQFQGLKNDVRIDLRNSDYDLVKISLLLSDFTSIFPYHNKNFLYTFDPKHKERKIIGPKKYLDEIANKIPNGSLFAGYGSVAEEFIEEVFEKFSPLIKANKVFIRPEKIVFVVDMESGHATVHPADPNSGFDEWRVIVDSNLQKSYPLFDKDSATEHDKKLSEILIPYLKGVEIKEYSKIILDEEDLLSSFRLQTKTYLQYLKNNNPNSDEFRADIINPKLDTINRKFKTIINNHRLKIAGATLGTVGLAVLSLTQTGLTAALSQFISFGLGTVGFSKSEAEYRENVDKLKDIPEYLLWKIRRG